MGTPACVRAPFAQADGRFDGTPPCVKRARRILRSGYQEEERGRMERFDIAIIGAGVGACMARECARFQAAVVVLEAGLDVAEGATRATRHRARGFRPGARHRESAL